MFDSAEDEWRKCQWEHVTIGDVTRTNEGTPVWYVVDKRDENGKSAEYDLILQTQGRFAEDLEARKVYDFTEVGTMLTVRCDNDLAVEVWEDRFCEQDVIDAHERLKEIMHVRGF